uniref:Uncharacterized protein n=1 Tax=Amphimedon queenslandica TaxID=400682 RepID=A0A1X7UD53_AMPQE
LFLIFCISGSSFSLDRDDFYQDPSATTLAAVSDDGSASGLSLPLTITNIKGLPNDSVLAEAAIRPGLLSLSPPTYNIGLQRRPTFTTFYGRSTLKISENVSLRNRALNDIKAKFPALNKDTIYPTHLLLFEVDNLFPHVGTIVAGTIAQLVLATNGRYTFGIVLIVRVYFDSLSYTGSYNDDYSQLLVEYPFAANGGYLSSSAATESNVDTPGKYIIDFNDALPPPPVCQCKKRGLPNDSALVEASITGGLLSLSPPTYNIGLQRRTASAGYSGSSTLKISVDVPLRNRALNDIKAKFPALNGDSIYPTHLLLFEVDDLYSEVFISDYNGTIAQLVLATNGRYTFGIVLIVHVYFDTSTFTGSYNDDFSELLLEYPFATNGVLNSNAAMDSNVGTSGKYVIDFNDALPPVPVCQCKKRVAFNNFLNVEIFTQNHPHASLAPPLSHLPPEAWLRMGIGNCRITKISIRPNGHVSLREMGGTGHLPPELLTFN